MCLLGDGTTNIGAFHESLNLAALWRLPIVYVIVNNRLGMGTPVERPPPSPTCTSAAAPTGSPASGWTATTCSRSATPPGPRCAAPAPSASPACWRRSATGCAGTRWSTRPATGPRRRPSGCAALDPVPAFRARLLDARRPRRGRGAADRRGGRRSRSTAAVTFADDSPDPDPGPAVRPRLRHPGAERAAPAARATRSSRRIASGGGLMAVITYRQALHDTLRAELLRDRAVFLHRRGDRRLRGLLQDHRRAARRVRARAGPRHPDLRGGVRRRRDRRGDARACARSWRS